MNHRIGFSAEANSEELQEPITIVPEVNTTARKSIVEVDFEGYGRPLSYYNDRFDLHCGDLVFVSGKLEGKRGRVTRVNYNFKIRLADYERVIAVPDTRVTGRFYLGGSHVLSFDPTVLPKEKVLSWFAAPAKEEDEFVSSTDEVDGFYLNDLDSMKIQSHIADRGVNYYLENRVRYLCLEGTKGYALVEGGSTYEVEFTYEKGEIRNLLCSCFCTYHCKHEFAVMMQLRDILTVIHEDYAAEYEASGYFAAVYKGTFFNFAMGHAKRGSFIL